MKYNKKVKRELKAWQRKMEKRPSVINDVSKDIQVAMNRLIPEKIHQVITAAIEQMTRGVLFGAGFTTRKPRTFDSLEAREQYVLGRIDFYRTTAAAEGAVTGFGGVLLGLADFPIWLTLKMKMLFEIAAGYGIDTKDYRERVYILHIFQLTFSSQRRRREIFAIMKDWKRVSQELPDDIHQFDWRNFQQEYRDYIDLAKLLQLIPGIGAVVGAYVNHRLTKKLGVMAMNAYRMRGVT
ncbi:MAG TPA: EcsC family protein [Cyclobacteriaceae bacterium]|nr:EcsC family protein [Cyclobacteriaceae bacterium]